MKAVCYLRPGLDILEMPEPQIARPHDVKIKIAYASICGTDPHIVDGHFDALYPKDKAPFILGHESSGVVSEVGSDVDPSFLKPGDRVVFYFKKYCGECVYCRNGKRHLCKKPEKTMHGMADYIVVDEQQVYKIPDDVPLRLAALTEPVSVGVHATDLADLHPGLSLCVFGGGAIGLLVMQSAKLSGCVPILVCEPVEEKRKKALELGADYALDPNAPDFMEKALEITKGLGFDRVMECAGFSGAALPSFQLLGIGGTLVYVSAQRSDYEMPFNLYKLFEKEGTVKGVYQSGYAMERAVRLLKSLKLEEMITAEYDVSDALEAFQAHRSGKNPKVVIRFDGSLD